MGFAGAGAGALRNGRFVAYAIERLLYVLHIEGLRNNGILTFVFIVMSGALATWLTYEALKCKKGIRLEDIVLVDVGVLLTFCNAFLAEWYVFSECMDFYIFSFAGAIAGAIFTANGYQRHGARKYGAYLAGFLCLVLSYNSYQIGLEIYAFWAMILNWVQNRQSYRSFIKSSIVVAISSGLAVILNSLSMKALAQVYDLGGSRYASFSMENLLIGIKGISETLSTTWIDGNRQLPSGMFLVVIIALFILFVMSYRKGKSEAYDGMTTLVTLIVILLAGTLIVYVPIAMQGTVYLTNRVCVALFGIFGALAVGIVYTAESNKLIVIGAAVLALFYLANGYSVQNIAQETFATNAIDHMIALQIEEQIEAYEAENGCEVEYVGFTEDASITYLYPDIVHNIADQGMRAFSVSWNRLPCLIYYSGRAYQSINVPADVYQSCFEGRNWNMLNLSEQMVFDGNRVYICIY